MKFPCIWSSFRAVSSGRCARAGLLSLLLTALLGLTGCVSYTKKAAAPEVAEAMKGAIVARTGGGTKFQLLTSEAAAAGGFVAALTGGIGGAVVIHSMTRVESEKIQNLGGLTDPSIDVSRDIGARLQQTRGSRVSETLLPVQSESTKDISSSASSTARFVLDIRTRSWGATYLPTQWNRYTTTFALQARLIDKSSGTSVAEGHCRHIDLKDPNPSTYEQLIANRAERIRTDFARYSASCVDEVWDQMFPSLRTSGLTIAADQVSDSVVTRASGGSGLQPEALHSSGTAVVPVGLEAPLMKGKASIQSSGISPSSEIRVAPREGTNLPMAEAASATSVDKVLGTPTVVQRYQLYLSRPKPKAFAVSDSGASWMAWGESMNPTVKETIPQRALRGCQERSQTPCVLYAIDDKVVYGQGLEGKR